MRLKVPADSRGRDARRVALSFRCGRVPPTVLGHGMAFAEAEIERAIGWRARAGRWLRQSETGRGYTLLSPTILIMLAALAAPMALLALYSFWSQDGLGLDKTFTTAQYTAAFGRETYRALFYRSLEISGIVTLVTVGLAYPMAYFVAFRVERTKFVWLILLTIPFWTSYLLRVFAWKIILGYNGVINSSLMDLGLIKAPLEFLLYNPFAVIVTLAHAWAAFAIPSDLCFRWRRSIGSRCSKPRPISATDRSAVSCASRCRCRCPA